MSSSAFSGSSAPINQRFVKQYFKSPVTLVIAILSLISLLSQFMISSAAGKLASQIASATGQSGLEDSVSGSPVSYILSAVVTACIFLIFFMSMAPGGNPGIWFSTLHILSVLQLIFTALGALFAFVIQIVLIFSTSMLVQFLAGSSIGNFSEMTEEQQETISRTVASFRSTFLIILVVSMVIFGLVLYYINAQTAFLNSVTLTCKNPMLKSKGAATYGSFSIIIGLLQLISVVIFYLTVGGEDTSAMSDLGIPTSIDFSSFTKPYLIYAISNALYIVVRGYFAKGWDKFVKENEGNVYETAGAGSGTRLSDVAPMPTYKSTTRASSDARQQSQPYLIGEEEDKNKKSSYIPEELQTDYNAEPQMYGGGQQPGMDPYGNPYGNPYGQQQPPMGADPFAAPPDPYAQNPYGQQQNPYGQNPYGGNPYNNGGQGGYNNGMM